MNDTTTTLAIGHRTIPLDPPRPPRKPDMLLWIDTETTGRDPYQNHAGTHRVQDCIHRDINDYTAYLDIMRAGHQGIQS